MWVRDVSRAHFFLCPDSFLVCFSLQNSIKTQAYLKISQGVLNQLVTNWFVKNLYKPQYHWDSMGLPELIQATKISFYYAVLILRPHLFKIHRFFLASWSNFIAPLKKDFLPY